MRKTLLKELLQTRYIHAPLPIHYEDTREARCEKKPVLESKLLDKLNDLKCWDTSTLHFTKWDENGLRYEEGEDYAKIELSNEHIHGKCAHSIKYTSPTRLPGVPEKNTWRGGIMCVPRAFYHVNDENWEHWNRISCWIYPDMPGFRNVCLRMQFHNAGEHPAPDRYDRAGHHNINLVNQEWNHVQVEIPYIYRDHVMGISFDYDMCDSERMATDTACWYISDLRAECLAQEELDHHTGWKVGNGRIAFSGSGYQTGSRKTALISDETAKTFCVVEAKTGRTILEKEVKTTQTATGIFQILDFSEVCEEGDYYLRCGDKSTRVFPVGNRVWEDSIWKTINFFLCERCGCYVPGKHNACCRDRFIEHNGLKIAANGGWHDAGDMSQTLTNTSEITASLFELAKQVEDNEPLYERLVEEGLWGLDWMLKTRFGDGFRAMDVGGSYWTDGIIGTGDDRNNPAQNLPIENFMAAGAEALGAEILMKTDKVYAAYALKCAKEDWKFAYRDRALEDYSQRGDPARASHPVVMNSCAVWAAVDIYNVDHDEKFKNMAVQLAKEVMDCQQQEIPDWDIPFTGFFYRDSSKKLIVHYNHRSHEQEPLLALTKLCTAFPDHPDWIKWYYAIVLYSEYYKKAVQYTAPYYMSPASIYHEDEANADPKLFVKQQAEAGEETVGMYNRQVHEGIPLGKGYYLRRFPVWFSFRGNNAIALASGKAAAMSGLIRNKFDLAELGQRQLEWIVGKNPFAQSVMYGEGYDYGQQYAVLPGEMVGELSVGIQAFEDQDAPYWPQVNTCTYKEVWVHVPLRWAWLCADTYGSAFVSGQLKSSHEGITFENAMTGKKYAIRPDSLSGNYAAELPAGDYVITCGNTIKHAALLPTKSYVFNAPLADYQVKWEQNENQVTVTLKTSGCGETNPEIRCENLELNTVSKITLGETVVLKGKITDMKKPYLAVIIPDGNMEDKLEVFGQ